MKWIRSWVLFVFLSVSVPAFTEMYGIQGGSSSHGPDIPENVDVRKAYSELIFAPMNEVLDFPKVTVEQPYSDHRVMIHTRRQHGNFYLLFTNEEDYRFPLYSRGSYIIKRSGDDGRFIQVKIFIRSEAGSFIRVFPNGDRSSMDLYLMGYPVYRDVNLSIPFEYVLTRPMESIIRNTGRLLDWSLISSPPYHLGQKRVEEMVVDLKKTLPHLSDLDDGAMDYDGTYRLIEDLSESGIGGFNCSGFAKWIVDGMYAEQHGRYLSIEELKEKPVLLRGNKWSRRFEDERDPYFGLDWTRNLASAVQGGDRVEEWDVREIPFFRYTEDMGYPIEHLPIILYLLAQKKSGQFYLASVNSEYGEDPVLRQHFHVAVLFPYFDEQGVFKPVVMERNLDTELADFIRRYAHHHIHLVQIEAPKNFSPAKLPR